MKITGICQCKSKIIWSSTFGILFIMYLQYVILSNDLEYSRQCSETKFPKWHCLL